MLVNVITVYTIVFCAVWTLLFVGFMWTLQRIPRLDEELYAKLRFVQNSVGAVPGPLVV